MAAPAQPALAAGPGCPPWPSPSRGTSFLGRRVLALGVGPRPIPRWKLTADRLAAAPCGRWPATGDAPRAAELGEAIRAEDGVGRAVRLVSSLVASSLDPRSARDQGQETRDQSADKDEVSWTRFPTPPRRAGGAEPAPFFVRAFRPIRFVWRCRVERVAWVEVRGLEHLREAVDRDQGVVIASNHAHHSDPFVMLCAADVLGRPFYYMVGLAVVPTARPFERWVIRGTAAFSVDREGTDLPPSARPSRSSAASPTRWWSSREGEVVPQCGSRDAVPSRGGRHRPDRPAPCTPAGRLRPRRHPLPVPRRPDAGAAAPGGRDGAEGAGGPRRRSLAEPPGAARPKASWPGASGSFWGALRPGRSAPGRRPHRDDPAALEARYGIRRRRGRRARARQPVRRGAIRQKESSPSDSPASRQAARDLEDANVGGAVLQLRRRLSSESRHRAPRRDRGQVRGGHSRRHDARNRGRRRAVIGSGRPIAAAPFQEKSDGNGPSPRLLESRGVRSCWKGGA